MRAAARWLLLVLAITTTNTASGRLSPSRSRGYGHESIRSYGGGGGRGMVAKGVGSRGVEQVRDGTRARAALSHLPGGSTTPLARKNPRSCGGLGAACARSRDVHATRVYNQSTPVPAVSAGAVDSTRTLAEAIITNSLRVFTQRMRTTLHTGSICGIVSCCPAVNPNPPTPNFIRTSR